MSTTATRSFKRRHLIYNLGVTDADSGRRLGHLVDITPRGLMVMTATHIEDGEERRLQIDLSSAPPVRELGEIEVNARSLWCRQSINPDLYDAGFELLDPSPAATAAIARVIDEIGFADLG